MYEYIQALWGGIHIPSSKPHYEAIASRVEEENENENVPTYISTTNKASEDQLLDLIRILDRGQGRTDSALYSISPAPHDQTDIVPPSPPNAHASSGGALIHLREPLDEARVEGAERAKVEREEVARC